MRWSLTHTRGELFGIAETGFVLVLSRMLLMSIGYAAREWRIGPLLMGVGIILSLAVIGHCVIGSLR